MAQIWVDTNRALAFGYTAVKLPHEMIIVAEQSECSTTGVIQKQSLVPQLDRAFYTCLWLVRPLEEPIEVVNPSESCVCITKLWIQFDGLFGPVAPSGVIVLGETMNILVFNEFTRQPAQKR
jgi:hypothetical protein